MKTPPTFLTSAMLIWSALQHEYGIFGGSAGSHILRLLRRLKMPVVTTLHTVLREPDANQRIVMEEIAALSDRLIVMSEHSSQALQEVFVPKKRSTSFLMAFRTCHLEIPTTTRILREPKARLCCSRWAAVAE
jgi:hypothetical protein